jgi:8-oxo-dGTP pyrophosphatase MutT (NUDIX family)
VREAQEEAGLRVRVVGYLGHWIDEYLAGDRGGREPEYCAVSYYNAVPVGELNARPDPAEVGELAWFEPDSLPSPLSPPANGPGIYRAWREALETGRLETPLAGLVV